MRGDQGMMTCPPRKGTSPEAMPPRSMKQWFLAAVLSGACLGLPLAPAVAQDARAAASAPAAAAAASGPAADGVRSSRFRIKPVDDAWRRNLPRDADAATQAFLDRLP